MQDIPKSAQLLRVMAWLGALCVIAAEIAPVLSTWGRQVISPYGGIDAIMQAGLLEWSLVSAWTTHWTSLPVFFPVAGTLAYMDSLLGQAMLVVPLHWLGVAAPASLYNCAYLATLVLAGVGMSVLCRASGGRAADAGVAVIALVGSPYTVAQLCHLNQLPMPFALFAAAALIAALSGDPRESFGSYVIWWLLGAALVVQAASGWYGFAYAAITCSVLVIVYGAGELCARWNAGRRGGVVALRRLGRLVLRAALPLVLSGVGVFLLAEPYRTMQHRYPDYVRSREDVRYDSGDIKHLIEGGAYRVHVSDLIGRGPRGEARYLGKDRQVLQFGWVATALAGYGFICRRSLSFRQRRAGYGLLGAGAAGLVLAFGESTGLPGTQMRLTMPFEWLRELVPAFKAYRAVWRFSFLTVVAIAWWAGMGWSIVARRARSRRRILAAAVVLCLLVVESIPFGLPAADLGFDGTRRPIASVPPGPLLTLPAPRTEYEEDATEARWLLWALEADRRVTGGVSGWVPPEARALRQDLFGCEQGTMDAFAFLADMKSTGIVGAVIAIRPEDGKRIAFWKSLLIESGATLVEDQARNNYEIYSWDMHGPVVAHDEHGDGGVAGRGQAGR